MYTATQYPLDIALPRFATFTTFVNTQGNELLNELISLTKSDNEPRQLFLWGAKQTGKTHLLQAVCNSLVNTEKKSVYFPLRELANFDAAIMNDMHSLDVICIDDVDQIFSIRSWEQGLFNLINEVRNGNKSLVMSARVNPHSANTTLADLASRLVWGPVYKLELLDDVQIQKAIQLHAKARGFEISTDVSSYLIKRYPRNISKFIQLLDQIDEQTLVQQRRVTVPFVKTFLN